MSDEEHRALSGPSRSGESLPSTGHRLQYRADAEHMAALPYARKNDHSGADADPFWNRGHNGHYRRGARGLMAGACVGGHPRATN